MAKPDDITAQIEQIVATSRDLPLAEKRHEVMEQCQALYDLGMESSVIAEIERECLERLLAAIRPGDNWTLLIDGVYRHANIVADLGRGFWRCVDMETGAMFVADDRSFVERMPEA